MKPVKYEFVKGFRENSTLLYIPKEKNLYVQKSSWNNIKHFVCYQSILCGKGYKNKENVACSARAVIHENKSCTRNKTAHSCHLHHEAIRKDLITINNLKSTCRNLKELISESSWKISVREIFNRELAK